MILTDIAKALAQVDDPRFRRVLLLGIGLALALLAALHVVLMVLLGWLLPESVALPVVGEVGWVDDVVSGASLVLMLVLSMFLMVPVAAAFTGVFLEDVAAAVEARHYPHLGAAPSVGLVEALGDGLSFLGVVVAVNLVALVIYVVAGPLAPVIFWAINGYLLGREYFQMVAMRRLGRAGATRLRRRHGARIWAAGTVMALPLSVPVLNLVVPVLGVASFTHLFHRLAPSGRTRQGRAT